VHGVLLPRAWLREGVPHSASRLQQSGQGRPCSRQGLLKEHPVLVAAPLEDGAQQVVFAREIPVDRAGAQSRLARDLLHRRALQSTPDKDAHSRVADLVAPSFEVSLGHLRHHWPPALAKVNEWSFIIVNMYSPGAR